MQNHTTFPSALTTGLATLIFAAVSLTAGTAHAQNNNGQAPRTLKIHPIADLIATVTNALPPPLGSPTRVPEHGERPYPMHRRNKSIATPARAHSSQPL